jgi:hypothetical protein
MYSYLYIHIVLIAIAIFFMFLVPFIFSIEKFKRIILNKVNVTEPFDYNEHMKYFGIDYDMCNPLTTIKATKSVIIDIENSNKQLLYSSH